MKKNFLFLAILTLLTGCDSITTPSIIEDDQVKLHVATRSYIQDNKRALINSFFDYVIQANAKSKINYFDTATVRGRSNIDLFIHYSHLPDFPLSIERLLYDNAVKMDGDYISLKEINVDEMSKYKYELLGSSTEDYYYDCGSFKRELTIERINGLLDCGELLLKRERSLHGTEWRNFEEYFDSNLVYDSHFLPPSFDTTKYEYQFITPAFSPIHLAYRICDGNFEPLKKKLIQNIEVFDWQKNPLESANRVSVYDVVYKNHLSDLYVLCSIADIGKGNFEIAVQKVSKMYSDLGF